MADSNLGSSRSILKPGESQIIFFYANPEYVNENDFSIINKDTISQVQNIDTLVDQLTKKNAQEDEWPEESHIKKLKLWWLLASSLESKISSLSNKVVIPMVEYLCRVIALKGKYLTLKKITFEVIARLLESKTDREQVMEMHEEWENYEWVLEPLPEENLWDCQTISALLNYFYHLLGTAKKNIKACMLVKISLHLSEKLKDCNDMEMYITFLNCFECLMCFKRLKEKAFVILAVSSSFMITNTLSILTKENETDVNQVNLLFQNKSRKLHRDVMNMLLNLFPLLLEQIVAYEIASKFFEHMMSSFELMFQKSADQVLPYFTSKLSRLWQKLCQCIKRIYGQTCSAKDLTMFFPLIELALQHSNRIIKKCSKKLWESTFNHLPEQLLPESLKLILAKTGIITSHLKSRSGDSTLYSIALTEDRTSHSIAVTEDRTSDSITEPGDSTSHSKSRSGDSTLYSIALTEDRTSHSIAVTEDRTSDSMTEPGDSTCHSKSRSGDSIVYSIARTEESTSHSIAVLGDSTSNLITEPGDSTSHSKISDQGNECAQRKSKEHISDSELETSLLEEIKKKTCRVSIYKLCLPVLQQATADEANPVVQTDFWLPITEIETDAVVEAIRRKMQEEKTTKKGQNDTGKEVAKLKNAEQKVKSEKKYKIKTEEKSQQEAKFSIPNRNVSTEDKVKIKADYLSCLNVVTKTEEILEFLTANQLLELNAKLNSLVCKSLKIMLDKKRDSL